MQLSVRFEPAQDRQAHQLVVNDPDAQYNLARSVEGTEHDPWPPSPVTVEVDACQTRDATTAILGVGMGGGSHWSLAIETCSGPPESLVFDVACRLNSCPGFLGSTYEIGPSINQHRLDEHEVELLSNRYVATIRALIGKVGLTDAGQIVIEPVLSELVLPTTARWKYVVESRLRRG